MIGEPTPLQVAMRDGRNIAVAECNCGSCGNEWFVVNHEEFAPRFCPYCGIRFVYTTESDMKPAPEGEQ